MTKRIGFQVDHRNYLIKDEKTLEDKSVIYTLEFATNPFYLFIKDGKFELLNESKTIISTGLVSNIKTLGYKDESYQ